VQIQRSQGLFEPAVFKATIDSTASMISLQLLLKNLAPQLATIQGEQPEVTHRSLWPLLPSTYCCKKWNCYIACCRLQCNTTLIAGLGGPPGVPISPACPCRCCLRRWPLHAAMTQLLAVS
jgi:hypothetical protein